MKDKILLPFEIDVEMRTYQYIAFPLGIIKANLKDYDIWLCGKLINCVKWSSGVFESFEEDLWSVRDGLMFSQNIYLAPQSLNYSGIDIFTLNKSMLQNGFYITGLYDEYYIPGKNAYNEFNFNHDYVIFGYNDIECTFKSASYLTDKTYGYFNIKYGDYLNAVINNDISQTNLNYYMINSNFRPNIDILSIRIKLEDYLFSRRNASNAISNAVFGIDVWLELAKYVENAEDGLDARFGRFCMEHHGLMFKRIQTLQKNGYFVDETVEKEYEDIYFKTKMVHNLFIKYNVSKNRDLLLRISNILRAVVSDERRVIKLLIDNLDNSDEINF